MRKQTSGRILVQLQYVFFRFNIKKWWTQKTNRHPLLKFVTKREDSIATLLCAITCINNYISALFIKFTTCIMVNSNVNCQVCTEMKQPDMHLY